MSKEETHVHSVPEVRDYDEYKEAKCTTCNKLVSEMFSDPNDIDPTTKVSQQPHGQNTLHCNICEMYVKPTKWEGEDVCPYHQRTMSTEEGPVLMYDEFDQDGEEW